MVKMESVSKIAILGQKMMTKSGLDFDHNNMKNLRKNRDKVWYIKAFLVKGFAYMQQNQSEIDNFQSKFMTYS